MALAATHINSYVTVSSATTSDHLTLSPDHEYKLSFTSAGAFVVALQELAGDGSTWVAVHDCDGAVIIDSTTGRQTVIVVSGQYRIDATTYNDPITMWARQV